MNSQISTMSDCLHSTIIPSHHSLRVHDNKFGFTTCFKLSKSSNPRIASFRQTSICIYSTRNRYAAPFPSDEHEFESLDFGFLEKGKIDEIRLRRDQEGNEVELESEKPAPRSGFHEEAEDLRVGEFFNFRGARKGNSKLVNNENYAESQGLYSGFEELERRREREAVPVLKSRRQMMRRSSVIAKQVITIRSAISIGFVSQLWVDTSSWVVLVVEVRPNLLSGDCERFLLKEIAQVGDVILVEDENVIEDDFKLVGLETLVGYNVVTPSRQSIGKVRSFTFNINSGTVESLELDSFGISIIPSSLVSTYALFVEDVLEVVSDTVVVHEAAISRMQRLTKGFWGGQNAGVSNNEFEEQLDGNGEPNRAANTERRRKRLSTRKLRRKMRKSADDWELPMDYL